MGIQTTNMEVLIKLTDQFSGPLSSISKSLSGLNTSVFGLSKSFLSLTAAMGAVTLAAKQALDASDKLIKMAAMTGINTTNLQRMSVAAQAAGSDIDSLSTAFRMLSTHAEQAAEGNKAAVDTFRQIGISIYDVNGNIKSGADLFSEFADRISKTVGSGKQMADTVRLLGRGGTELLPLLKLGSAGIKEFGDLAEKLGLVQSPAAVEGLATFNRVMGLSGTAFRNMIGEWLASAADNLPHLIQMFYDNAEAISSAWDKMKLAAVIFWETVKTIATTIGTTFNAVVSTIQISVARLIPYITPILDQVQGLLVLTGSDMAAGVAKINDSLKAFASNNATKSLSDVWAGFADKIGGSFTEAQQAIAQAYNSIDANSGQQEADLKAKLQAAMQLFAKFREVVHNSNEESKNFGNVNRDAFDFFKGFNLAVADFTKNLGNWQIAWDGLFKSLDSGITSALDNFILKTHSVKDLMNDLFKSIETSFVHMLTTMATQQILGGLMGWILGGSNPNTGGGGGGGGGAADISSIGASIGGAMGGAAGLGNLFQATHEANQVANPTSTTPGGGGIGVFGSGIGATPLAGDLTLGGLLGGLGLGAAGFSEYSSAVNGSRVNVTHATIGGALSGAAAGAMIGSVIPGIGTVIGGVVGAIAGGVGGFLGGKSAKAKQQKAEEEAAQAQAEAEQAMRNQARQLVMADIRAKYGGGLADTSAMPEIGEIMSHGLTDAELDKIGSASDIVAQGGAIGSAVSNISVGSPNIVVNAQVAGAYDVQRLAEDLGLQLSSSIRSAASGAGP